MAEDLSQQQIDEMLAQKGGGGSSGDATDHKPYDFKAPSLIPAGQKKTLTLLHEIFAQTVGLSLSAFLRSDVQFVLE